VSGAFAHASGGETSWPGGAYLSGIRAPSAQAGVVNAIGAMPPRPRPPCPPSRNDSGCCFRHAS
jgi:hypothetical protein